MITAPVTGLEIYRNDVVVVRTGDPPPSVEHTRSEITHFSRKSRQRLAFVANNTPIEFTALLTLTYPRTFPNDGLDVKRNLNNFLTVLRRQVSVVHYLWFLEFQKRGAPHIHILIRGLRVSKHTQQWCSETWYRICATGDDKHLRAGTRLERIRKRDGARRYVVKYAGKMCQKWVPPGYRNVGRFWGHSRDVKPEPESYHQCTHDDIVAALLTSSWPYLRDDETLWRVLYNAAPNLRSWLFDGMLVLSTSSTHVSVSRQERRKESTNV